ncbi:UNVERIFIED_CONTAM: hypothetical protein Scaly_3056400 [Sesamum calycinum]|uniref:Reverse transcriptase domain-containing protein n=1 Tax=Sesamum calycinum TaxID=2727403 RepID=A0AAW2K2R1_9LAMI
MFRWNLRRVLLEELKRLSLNKKLYRFEGSLKVVEQGYFCNVFYLVDQAKAAGNEAEKQFYRLPSEANLINLNRQNAALVHALNLESEFWRQKRTANGLKPEKGKPNSFIPYVVGPDGFSIAFFQAYWNTIAEDVIAVVTDFFRGTPVPRSFTAISIILIPKNDSPQSWSEFRPISLCNVTNKILSKLLYTRLSQALPDLLSPSQSAFVPGRLIADNILLAQEMAHHLDMRYT